MFFCRFVDIGEWCVDVLRWCDILVVDLVSGFILVGVDVEDGNYK